MSGKLEGRTAIVTGASRGLGEQIVKRFREEGATVIAPTRKQLEKESFLCTSQDMKFEVLVNCSGEYGPIGQFETLPADKWVNTITTNLFMSVAMCQTAVPVLKKNGYGKIIQISGGGATKPMPGYSAYAASKAAVVRFAETLAEELRGTGIDVNSLAPGALNTRLKDQALAAGADPAVYKDADANMEKACDLAVFLASAESDGITGKLISAVWDDWRAATFQERCRMGDDAYTLRRTVACTECHSPSMRCRNCGAKQ